MNLTDLTLREISAMLIKRKVAAMELLDEYLNIALQGSCISFCSDEAFDAARKVDEIRLISDQLSPLAGLPYSIKDNFCTEGILTSCNSRSLRDYRPDYDAAVVKSISKYRGILTAKVCMREYSVGRVEDSAFELRNYLVWAGTNKNVNIGAFMIGSDIGLGESFCGIWTLKPAIQRPLLKGMITAAPTLEKATLNTRRAEDLSFVLPFMYSGRMPELGENGKKPLRVLVYDADGFDDYISLLLKEAGYHVEHSDDGSSFAQWDCIYHCILCVDFYRSLKNVGKPSSDAEETRAYKEDFRRKRAEGFGFETKRNIVTGAHLTSKEQKENMAVVLRKRDEIVAVLDKQLESYDFIAAPAVYDDGFVKAAAMGNYSELTIPFADVYPIRVITKPEKERLLLDMAAAVEKAM